MKKILVPTDFSENARQALDVAVKVAKKTDAEIVLLHVNEQKIYKTETFTLNEEQVIFDFAKEKQADLIVMDTHQRRGLAHILLGSLTEDAINHAAIPVLAIPIR